jgi:hypothetical protein
MKLTDLFRRLVSHFTSPNRSDRDTKEVKQQQHHHHDKQSSVHSAPSSSTTESKSSTTTTINNATMPGITSKTTSKYDAIPGPVGLQSASLAGKVALVTGAGM